MGRFVTVGHTDSRVEELDKTLNVILKAGKLSRKEAERLRGRMQWFESFASGRVAQQALLTLSKMTTAGRVSEILSEQELVALKVLRRESFVRLQQRLGPLAWTHGTFFQMGLLRVSLLKKDTMRKNTWGEKNACLHHHHHNHHNNHNNHNNNNNNNNDSQKNN